MQPAREPWWIIGSAAVALHGGLAGVPRDVDILLDRGDAARLLPTIGLHPAPGIPNERFRSALFARWDGPPLPVEFMAGLQLSVGGDWQAVLPISRQPVKVGEVTAFIPSREELIAILRRFGRPKDLLRLKALEAVSASVSRVAP